MCALHSNSTFKSQHISPFHRWKNSHVSRSGRRIHQCCWLGHRSAATGRSSFETLFDGHRQWCGHLIECRTRQHRSFVLVGRPFEIEVDSPRACVRIAQDIGNKLIAYYYQCTLHTQHTKLQTISTVDKIDFSSSSFYLFPNTSILKIKIDWISKSRNWV